MHRPLVAIALAFAAGIALAELVKAPLAVNFVLLVVATGCAVITCLLGRNGHGHRAISGLLLTACLAAGLFWATLDRTTHQSRLLDDLHTHLYLTGMVAAEPQVYANRVVYVLDATEAWQQNWREQLREKVQVIYYLPERAGQRAGAGAGQDRVTSRGGQVLVTWAGGGLSHQGAGSPSFPLFTYGDVLQVFGQLEQPSLPRNPGEFNYRAFLARQGIFTRMAVDDPEAITRVASGRGHPLVSLALAAKGRAVAAIEAALPYPEAGILQAVLFGDRGKLDDHAVDVFKNLGVFHLFAVSGLHVGFLLVFIIALAGLLGLRHWERFWLGALLLLFYASVTGFTPSVNRASLMAGTLLLGRALGEKMDPYTNLALAALVILVASPQQLFMPGFQMSFLATWGIVYLYPLLHGLLGLMPGLNPIAPPGTAAPVYPSNPQVTDAPGPLRGWFLEKAAALGCSLRESVAVSAGAQVAVLPLSAAYFNLVSPGALLANLVVVPLAGLAVTLGLVLFLTAQIAIPLASLFAYAAGSLLWATLLFLQFLSHLPGMAFSVPSPNPWVIILFPICLVVAKEMRVWRNNPHLQTWGRKLLPLAGAAVAVTLAAYLLLLHPHGELKVVFIDVGQGSSIYLEMPNGKDMLVDGGGTAMPLPGSNFHVGEDVVVPFLVRQGVRRVDLLVSTHPDADHIQGLETVLTSLPVSLAVLPPPDWFGPGYDNFLSLAGYRETTATVGRTGLAPGGGLDSSGVALRLPGLFSPPSPVPVAPVTRGYQLRLDPAVEIEVLHPQHYYTGTRSDDNNASLVLQVSYGQVSFLLTGDVEEEGMKEMLAEKIPIASTVLLLPHHGSRYSFVPEFYRAVNPAAVVTQAGEHNTFGHPAPEIVAYWEEKGVPVYRTDRHGAITFTTDGKNLRVETAIPFDTEK